MSNRGLRTPATNDRHEVLHVHHPIQLRNRPPCPPEVCLRHGPRDGKKLIHTNIKNNDFEFFLKLVPPYRHDLTVCAECMFSWYWLADACQAAGLHFVLAHALYLKAIHGGKNKNDRIDSEKIAHLLRTNLIPPAYYEWRTEQAYRMWAKRFADRLAKRGGNLLSTSEVELRDFLSDLATQQRAAAATQKQALNARVNRSTRLLKNLVMFYVYMLQSESDDGLYIGRTTDLRRRLKAHQSGESFATSYRGPWKLIYYEAYL
jgi:GIY-YIG catalytic domain/Phage integrase, N-terminal SAM-like domain